jgi:hypothetical protein
MTIVLIFISIMFCWFVESLFSGYLGIMAYPRSFYILCGGGIFVLEFISVANAFLERGNIYVFCHKSMIVESVDVRLTTFECDSVKNL